LKARGLRLEAKYKKRKTEGSKQKAVGSRKEERKI
jgi:hypothetical protein